MAKQSGTALLLVAGGAALLLAGGKKKSKKGSDGASGGYAPGGDVYPGGEPLAPSTGPKKPVPQPPAPTDGGDEEWIERQHKLYVLGYDEVGSIDGEPGADTVTAIKLFQQDWNLFVDFLKKINPETDYQHPYTKTSVDGKWGNQTEVRVNKAFNKFDGSEPVYVEEPIDKDVDNWRGMINAIRNF